MDRIISFFSKLIVGGFGYDALKESIVKFNDAIVNNCGLSSFEGVFDLLGMFIPYITIFVMLSFIFCGKRILPAAKFILSFFVGMAISTCFFFDFVSKSAILAIALGVVILVLAFIFRRFVRVRLFGLSYVTGLLFLAVGICSLVFAIDLLAYLPAMVCGLLVLVLLGGAFGMDSVFFYRINYVVFYAIASFLGIYMICYSYLANLLDFLGIIKAFVFIAVALIGTIFTFIFRKHLEMFGTALLGSTVLVTVVDASVFILSYKIVFSESFSLRLIPIIIIALSLIGYAVQYKTRKKY